MVGESALSFQFSDEPVDRSLVARVRDHLDRGGLLVHPTRTVYGIGSAIDDRGIGALSSFKRRDPDKPFLLLVASEQMLTELGIIVTPLARRFISALWPGAVTLVLPSSGDRLPNRLRGPGGGVAVRQPAQLAMLTLIEALGTPITSTSANPAGADPASSVEEVAGYFPEAVASGELMLLDGGPLPAALPSSIIDCLGESPRMLREGDVSRAQLETLTGVSLR